MWGYTDRNTGDFVISPRFDEAEEFSEGLAGVGGNGQYGHINKTGKIAITPPYLIGAQLGRTTVLAFGGYTAPLLIGEQSNALVPLIINDNQSTIGDSTERHVLCPRLRNTII